MKKITTQDLPNNSASLREVQAYIQKVITARGFDKDTPLYKMVLLTEEVGELAKALRDHLGGQFDAKTTHKDVAEEIADTFICLNALANLLDVDIYDALIAKEKVNLERNWNTGGNL
jgi:NTP pyrophosphatase (non-canonical NTP hydrolase)